MGTMFTLIHTRYVLGFFVSVVVGNIGRLPCLTSIAFKVAFVGDLLVVAAIAHPAEG